MEGDDDIVNFMNGDYSQDELDGLGLNSDDSSCPVSNQPLREQDRFLPIANITKIMKKAIPENGKIAKDARECVQECVSEFISFITSEASDRCHQEKRKTINGEDLLFALCTLGFDNYIEPLKLYLQIYRDHTKSEKQSEDEMVLQAFEGGDGPPNNTSAGHLEPQKNLYFTTSGANHQFQHQ